MDTKVLVSPDSDVRLPLKAIIRKSNLHDPEFRESLRKTGLEIIDIEETTAMALQECLQYSCTAKMAPSWNLVQNLLVQGPDFLTTTSPLKAVKMDIFVSYREISLNLQPTCIKLPITKIEQYIKPGQLMTSSFIRLDENCHVLPSMKQAKILAVSKSPRTTGAFKNYIEIQRHWKDMYGYLLPNIPEQYIWYYNVTFRIPNPTIYTYPQFCIRPYKMTEVPRVDPKSTLSAFIKDFCKKVGNICGEKCKIVEGRASFTNLQLFPAVKITEDMRPRAGTTYTMKTNLPYRKDLPTNISCSRSNTQIDTTLSDVNVSRNTVSPQQLFTPKNYSNNLDERNAVNSMTDLNSLSIHFTFCSSEAIKDKISGKTEVSNKEYYHGTQSSFKTSDLTTSEKNTEMVQKKYAPCFFPKVTKNKLPSPMQFQSSNPTPRYAPNFLPMKLISNRGKSASSSIQKEVVRNEKNGGKNLKKFEKNHNGIQDACQIKDENVTEGKSSKNPVKGTKKQSELNFNVTKKNPVEKNTTSVTNTSIKKKKLCVISTDNKKKRNVNKSDRNKRAISAK